MPPRYLQCRQPFWTRSTCTWWTPIRPIWISPFLDVSKSGYLNGVSLSLIFSLREIEPFLFRILKGIFGDQARFCPLVSKFCLTFFQNFTNLWNSFTMDLLLHVNFQVYFLQCGQVNSKRTIGKKIYHSFSILSQRFLIRSREPVAKSQLES